MIITKTPFRITLGGGGTDIPTYYKKHGGFLISAAINKYMFISVNKRYDNDIRVSYSKTEIVSNVNELEHPIVREALKFLKINSGIEIASIADLPAKSGLGSSGTFTVGLLNALHTYQGNRRSPKELAEEAFYIESELLQEPCGKQDQYIAAFGGIIRMEIDQNGIVDVEEDLLNNCLVEKLVSNLMFFSTDIYRSSSKVLSDQKKAVKNNKRNVLYSMQRIKEIGIQCYDSFKKSDIDYFGKSLDLHWNIKKNISGNMTNNRINDLYNLALDNGAI
ncbi:MAG: hypothetical protein H8E98_06535, partial [Bacteroidetes bacterium]|nr:hypothetical protein [Bacteroidota bacterium]